MSQIRILLFGFMMILSGLFASANAQAQYASMSGGMSMGGGVGAQLGGSGVWGGNQGCTAQSAQRVPEEVQDIDDQIDELKQMARESKEGAKDATRELRKLSPKIKHTEATIRTILKDEISGGVVTHLREGISAGLNADPNRVCGQTDSDRHLVRDEYKNGAGAPIPQDFIANDVYCQQSSSGARNPVMLAYVEYSRPSQTAPGTMDKLTCGNARTTKPDYTVSQANPRPFAQRLIDECQDGMEHFHAWVEEENQNKKIIADAKAEQVDIAKTIKALRKDLRQAEKDAKEDGDDVTYADQQTQGGYCPTGNCGGSQSTSYKRSSGIVNTLIGAGAGLLGAAYISHENAKVGWPTSPYLITQMGLGPLMYGIYGSGQGATGACGGYGGPGGMYSQNGMGYGGGAFGYPGGWGPDGGGGAYNPGCGPWGCPNYPGSGGYGNGMGNMTGYMAGGMTGYMAGNMSGYMAGGMTGYMAGNMTGYMAGGMTGYMAGNMTGYMSGNATMSVLPYPMSGSYAGTYTGTYAGNYAGYAGNYAGGTYAGTYAGGMYSGYDQAAAAAAAAAAAQAAQYGAAVSMSTRLDAQIAAINSQKNMIWSSLGTANGGYYGGSSGYPTGTILPYPSTYDPNLGTSIYGTTLYGTTTTTGTTTTGVTPARGRFSN